MEVNEFKYQVPILFKLSTCLKRLKSDKIELLYLHAPDHNTDIGIFFLLFSYSPWIICFLLKLC